MSSTTDQRSERGQVIVIFALSLTTLIVIAALVFDGGMMLLQRRDQQNAADAAALAGARYLVGAAPTTPQAAARAIATANGFTDGVDDSDVEVFVPPVTGRFRGIPGFIEVAIQSERPSIFAGIMRIAGWQVSARAVAANQKGLDLPFSMLSLDPDDCPAVKVAGTGIVESNGTVQVNSSCSTQALLVSGDGTLRVTAEGAVCRSAGEIKETNGPGSELDCVQEERSYAIEDPLSNLVPPGVPNFPAAVQKVSGPSSAKVETLQGCPGSRSNAATLASPRACVLNDAGTVWRLFPGIYPGGLRVQKGLALLEPGIYYIAGGGVTVNGGAIRSVEPGGNSFGGGVLFYNTELSAFHDQCALPTPPTPAACMGPITLNGGAAEVNLKQLSNGSRWDGLVIFQDRNLNNAGKDVKINGGASIMEVAGTIYVPSGAVEVNGSTGTLILDQVIASTFKVNGNRGTIEIKYRSGVSARVSGVGLVE